VVTLGSSITLNNAPIFNYFNNSGLKAQSISARYSPPLRYNNVVHLNIVLKDWIDYAIPFVEFLQHLTDKY
jgi:hypothetical protein